MATGMTNRPFILLPGFLLAGLLLPGASASADGPDGAEPGAAPAKPGAKPPAAKPPAKPPSVKPAAKAAAKPAAKGAAKPGARPPSPPRVQLPPAGKRLLEEILPLVSRVVGREVSLDEELEEEDAGEPVLITITPEMAGRQATREELVLLLGAHGIYLASRKAPGGPLLFLTSRKPEAGGDKAASDGAPAPVAATFRRSFQLRSKEFDSIAREVQEYIAWKNGESPPGAPHARAAIDPRTRRIVITAPSERTVAGVEEIIVRRERSDPDAIHLYTYRPRFRPARELIEGALESLGEAEARKLTLVVPRRGNAILIRGPEELYQKVKKALESLDVPAKGRPASG